MVTANDRDAFAEWVARQHLKLDRGISEVAYLPADAPNDEIRLVEVNEVLYPDSETITALEIIPAKLGYPFRVSVADVTSDEWMQIQSRPEMLPDGWSLREYTLIRRAE